jgi:hypothetical protein
LSELLGLDSSAAIGALTYHISTAPGELIAYAHRHGLGDLACLPTVRLLKSFGALGLSRECSRLLHRAVFVRARRVTPIANSDPCDRSPTS